MINPTNLKKCFNRGHSSGLGASYTLTSISAMFFLAHHSYPKSNELGANCWGRNPPYELNVHKSWKTVNPAIQAMTSYGRDELWRIYASNGKLRHGELRTVR
ncbi:unnamed protein product [Microthlaspi erraticum]|uniref:Uncharacterized protein n=1 Tax=Microthlaspi erraticum TaxID=1685480 RepID=A0A6D2JW55_9BRAS|nr:unnamed protein product [Microthlaspi erraticum]